MTIQTHPKGDRRVLEKGEFLRTSKYYQIAITYTTAILGLSGCPWPGLHGPSGHYVGPHGARVPVWSPNDHPNPSQGWQNGFNKSQIFKNFRILLKCPNNGNFGFRGAHGLGYMGLAATTWVSITCTKSASHKMNIWSLLHLYSGVHT